jgi:hypothetical protein
MKVDFKIAEPIYGPACEQCGKEGGHAFCFFTTDDGMGMSYRLCPEENHTPAPRCDWCDLDLTAGSARQSITKMPHPNRAKPFQLCLECFLSVANDRGVGLMATGGANTVEQHCDYCGGAHPDRNIQIAKDYAVLNRVCPERPLADGGLCDRCDGDLSRETAMKITHRETPSYEFLIVCERCVEEISGGGAD